MGSKNILVVGAGSGIGRSLLEKLNANPEYFPIGISRRGRPLEESFERGKNYNCNLAEPDQIRKISSFISERWEEIHAIYFASGDGLFLKIEDLEWEDLQKHLILNLSAPILLTSKLLPLLKKGSLLCYLSSTAGRQGFSGSSPYCASKHGIAGFAKAIREEVKDRGIRVTTVFAGAIDTPIWDGREGFKREDMIPASDAAIFLESLYSLPASFNQDEILFLPPKGVL
ncbi:SDR family NAD(P)-dependent oxidoreductase [Leptospira sp. WS58.C1]|uniref:SDR family NAD(P)-dependent oxidoreductase n=1 Tax=Leptospira TaxID=171 RepID=UPI0002BD8AD7|nr:MULTISPECIES: SDR family oxidoreductase [unclassified Leptospira]EMJ99538.1 KR domain protein [Leptospira sp. B5-022]MCR1792522.1 SDR family oxidoreductase [Leptospira sp. id769339]